MIADVVRLMMSLTELMVLPVDQHIREGGVKAWRKSTFNCSFSLKLFFPQTQSSFLGVFSAADATMEAQGFLTVFAKVANQENIRDVSCDRSSDCKAGCQITEELPIQIPLLEFIVVLLSV